MKKNLTINSCRNAYSKNNKNISLFLCILILTGLISFKLKAQNCNGTVNYGSFGNTYTFNTATILTTGGKLSSNTICFRGTINLQANITINAAHIVMDDDAQILVAPGFKLILTDCWFQSCDHLHMWEKIQVDAGASLYATNSIIEDGKYAFNSNYGGVIDATNCDFNKDYIGIQIDHSALTTSPLSVNNCRFTCFENVGSVNLVPILEYISLNPGVTQEKTLLGIQILESKFVSVGDPTYTSNIFDGICVGLEVYKSAANIYNNIFTGIDNVQYLGGSVADRTGIYVSNAVPNPAAPLPDINIGNSGYSKNSFIHCYRGIFGSFWSNYQIINNEFSEVSKSIGILNYPTSTYPIIYQNSIKINSNSFYDCALAGKFQ